MNKGKLLILAILTGMKASHELVKGLGLEEEEGREDVARDLLATTKIEKEDLFTLTANGKSFFHYAETWKNLDKIRSILQESGEDLTYEDLADRVVAGNKSALQLVAEEKEILPHALNPAIWKGRSAEMENFWYDIPTWKRAGDKEFLEARRALAAAEGRELRIDQLERAGISASELQDAFKEGKFDDIKEKLEKAGDRLRMEDALILDSTGDHCLYPEGAWKNIDKFYDAIAIHGEKPGLDFFLFHRADKDTVLRRAITHNALDKVFNDSIGRGQPEMLLTLYRHVPEDKRDKIDLPAILSEIEEQEYASRFEVNESVSLQTLTSVLNEDKKDAGTPQGFAPVRALGMQAVWGHLDDVKKQLRQKGERLGADHLRLESGYDGSTCMMRAVRYGYIGKIVDIMWENGDTFNSDDFLKANKSGDTMLEFLLGKNELMIVLDPRLWKGRGPDLARLWEAVPESKKDGELKAKFSNVLHRVNRLGLLSLTSRFAGNAEGAERYTVVPPPPASGHPAPPGP